MTGSGFTIAGPLNPLTGLPGELQTLSDYVVSGDQCILPTGIEGENVSVKIPRPYERVMKPAVIPPMISDQIKQFGLGDVAEFAKLGFTLEMSLIDNADVTKAQQDAKLAGAVHPSGIFFRTAVGLYEKYKDKGVWIGTGPKVIEAAKNYIPEKPALKTAKTARPVDSQYQRRVERAPVLEQVQPVGEKSQPAEIIHSFSPVQPIALPAREVDGPELPFKPIGSLFFKSELGFEGRIPYYWLSTNEDYSGETTMLAILVDGREESPMMLPPRSDQQVLGISWYASPMDKSEKRAGRALLIHAPLKFGDLDFVVFSLLPVDPPEDQGEQ